MSDRPILLIGGTGFIGAALARRLAAEGREVHVLGRSADPGERGGIVFHRGNQGDAAIVAPLLARCPEVVHLASASTPGSTAGAPVREVEENLLPAARFLELLAAVAPRRLLLVSSGGALYGDPARLPADEATLPNPISFHAAAKLGTEALFGAYARAAGVSLAVLRPANVYGPGQVLRPGFGIVRTLLDKAHSGQTIDLWGDGRTVRDFLYIDDLVDACLRLLVMPDVRGTFNVGSGIGTTLLELVRLTEHVTALPISVTFHPARGIDVSAIWLDCSNLRTACGWQATTSLSDGLARTWRELVHGKTAPIC